MPTTATQGEASAHKSNAGAHSPGRHPTPALAPGHIGTQGQGRGQPSPPLPFLSLFLLLLPFLLLYHHHHRLLLSLFLLLTLCMS